MAATEQIRVEGLNEVLADLRRLGNKDVPKAIRRANLEAAEAVVEPARAEAPHRSGKLARSIAARATQRSGSVKAGSASRVPYAGPIHFGWFRRHIAPNPFLYRAIDAHIGQIRRIYEQEMDKAVGRFNR